MTEEKKKQEEQEQERQEQKQEEQTKKENGKPSEKKRKKDEKKQLKEEIETLNDQLLRNQAELQNFKRRMNEERIRERKFANAELVKSLLPVLDNFEIALKKERENGSEATVKGFEMIRRDFYQTLKDAGLEEIDAEGEEFDPKLHQAVMKEPRDDVEDNTVVEELQKGYLFKDRLLRASMVKVSEKTTPEETEKTPDSQPENEKGEC